MKTINRRTFLKSTAFTAAVVGLPASTWASAKGANEAIRVAVVGFGGRGAEHISEMRKLANKHVRIVALCDVDSKILNAGVESFAKRNEKVERYTDIRRLLENKDVDAITIATPNHWHSLATIWAVQAGKDVYVEKPVSHNVWEGRKAVEAARKYGKIVQTGTQSRSSNGIKEAVEWVGAGNLGKINIARGLCYKRRPSIGKTVGPQPVPDYIDYDLWCGPAPLLPPRRNSPKFGTIHYDWHWFWDYGCGDLGNQGIHQMDIARWFLGETQLSPAILSLGGRLGYEDDGETPNTQIVYHGYSKAPLIFEVRGLPEKTGSTHMDKYPPENGGSVCVNIECEGGRVFVPDYSSAVAYDKQGKEIKRWKGGENHFENFIKACRSRKISDLNADILEGHLSSALCHTGNISYRLGSQVSAAEAKERVKSVKTTDDASDTFERTIVEHLADHANRELPHLHFKLDLEKTKLQLGQQLAFDPAKEKFLDNSAADAMLTRDYRAPYVVPPAGQV